MSAKQSELKSINIRPGVTILSVLRHLNYRPWFALAEFVDNSLQSYLDHKSELEKAEGGSFKLKVSIDLKTDNGGRISIRDNAAGIHEKDYRRAFRPAEIPLDKSGLSEFGIGMKAAACWFSESWQVRTSALGEPLERSVSFDIDKIVEDKIEELDVASHPTKPGIHFTEIILEDLYQPPQGRTIGKIKEHLTSIYRVFLRKGVLELKLNGERLACSEPTVLRTPYYKMPGSEPILWKKEVDFDLGKDMHVHGFAAIRETASVSEAGFALFRKGRLIQGSYDEGYRPEFIFGKSNSFRYQRLFGELHLEGFEVSHTKDGFKWDENEEPFLELLKEELDRKPIALLEQAEQYRVRPKQKDIRPAAEAAAQKTADVIQQKAPPVLEQQLEEKPDSKNPPSDLLKIKETAASREIEVDLLGCRWRIILELSTDPAVGDWLEISDKILRKRLKKQEIRTLNVRLSLAHPFMERFAGADPDRIEPLLRVAAALALAEVTARESGVRGVGTVRRNVNNLLRDVLSKP